MRAATLFSGIGAPELACPHWSWLWHAEIEPFPAAVMAHHHPTSINLGDVLSPTFVDRAREFGELDCIVFGSPCQSFSVAGKRLGLDDPRGNLSLAALGIMDKLKPHYFIFENVPGLLSSDNGNDFNIFCDTVNEIGYYFDVDMLDAQYHGLAQRRQRVFAACENADLGRQRKTPSFGATGLSCLIEICLCVLAEAITPCGTGAPGSERRGPYSAAGLTKKMRLFGLPPKMRAADRTWIAAWQNWLRDLEGTLARHLNAPNGSASDFAFPADGLMNIADARSLGIATAIGCSSIPLSWSVILDAVSSVASKFTTSTATRKITHQEIFTCSALVLSICERITRSTILPESFYGVASLSLTALEAFIDYAKQTSSDLFSWLHGSDDWLLFIKTAERAHGELERRIADGVDPSQVLFESESMCRNPASGREAGQGATAGALAGTSPGGGWRVGADEAAAGPIVAYGGNDTRGPIDVATAVNAHGGPHGRLDFESETFVAHTLRGEGFDASEDGTGRGTPIVPVAFNHQAAGKQTTLGATEGADSALSCSTTIAVAFAENSRAEIRLEGGDGQTISALKTGGGKPGQSYPAVAFGISSDCFDRSGEGANGSAGERSGLGIIEEASAAIRAKRPNAVAHAMSVRRLLPAECEILQGFPPGFTDIPFKGKPAADGNRYRALGNSMAVPCLRWILSRIEAQAHAHTPPVNLRATRQ